jgi:Putative NADP-dependent oxidoreductases
MEKISCNVTDRTKSTINRRFILASRPINGDTPGDFGEDDLLLTDSKIPELKDGEVLFRNILISVDPYQRNLMGNVPFDYPSLPIGEVIPAPTVGLIMESRNKEFVPGDYITGLSSWQEYIIAPGHNLRKLNARGVPISTALGVLGHTGLTAWLGTTQFVDPKPGGTFVITNAAGSVGSLAVQLAKIRGHRVVAIAGGAEKTTFLRQELGVDVALDYKAANFHQQLRKALHNGIDRLLDSVGAYLFEELIPYFNQNAKIIILGQIGMYGKAGLKPRQDHLPKLLNSILYKDISIKGFQVDHHLDTYAAFLAEMTPMVHEGKIKYQENFVDGFEQLPKALHMLYNGLNKGKMIVRIV